MTKTLKSAEEVVVALDGPTRAAEALSAVARKTRYHPNTLGNWIARNLIPPHNADLVDKVAEANGYKVARSVYGMLE